VTIKRVNFTGATVEDDPDNDVTRVNLGGGSSRSGGAAIGNSGEFFELAWDNNPDYIDLVDSDAAIVSIQGGDPVPPRSSHPAGRIWLSDVIYDTAGFVGPAGPGKFVIPAGWGGIYLMTGALAFGLGNSVIMHNAQLIMVNGGREFAWGDLQPGVGGIDANDITQSDIIMQCVGVAALAAGDEVWCQFGLRVTNMAATTPSTLITYVTSGRGFPYFSITKIG
jgi:hypothetical protein